MGMIKINHAHIFCTVTVNSYDISVKYSNDTTIISELE